MSPRDPHEALLETAGHDRAVHQRRRRRQLLDHEGELASWEGALLDLAEARTRVQLELDGGRRHGGVLQVVAVDHLLLTPDAPRGAVADPDEVGSDGVLPGAVARTSRPAPVASPAAAATSARRPGLDDRRLAVSLTAVRSLRYVPGRPGAAPVHGDRRAISRRPLVELLHELVGEGTEVVIGLRGNPTVLRGTALQVGTDVVVLRGANEALTVLPTAAIGDVSWGSR